jgi:hypothetical protein
MLGDAIHQEHPSALAGEKYGGPLAFTFEGGFGGEDFLG